MKQKNIMHALLALLLSLIIVATGTLGGMQTVFAKTIEFKIDLGENKKTSSNTMEGKTNTITKKGTVAGISYEKLVMANVNEAVNVRSEGSESGKLVGKFYKDCGGSILERKSGWTKLQTGKLTGWVKDDYLLFGDEAAKLAESVVEKTAISTTSCLRVRENPNTDSKILDLLGEGDKIEVVSEEGEWVRVAFSDGDEGFVSAEFVKIEDTLDTGETIESINEKAEAEKKAKEAAAKSNSKNAAGQVSASTVTNNGAITGDVNDALLLAALIQAESGNEVYQGQVAVGSVVMNRLRTGKYGNSLYNVIYAKGQFGPAGSGLVAQIYARGPKASCIQAAQEAMAGTSYIGTATHFRNVRSGYPGIVIGNHVFW